MTQELKSKLDQLNERIAAAAAAADRNTPPCLIAVTKFQPVEKISTLIRFGHSDFGENYVQELITKAQEIRRQKKPEPRWHFIGHLQRNKVKMLLESVPDVVIHTIDTEKLARELQKRWEQLGLKKRVEVFIEVNVDSEEGKAGLPPDAEQIGSLAKAISELPALDLQGLMCIPSPAAAPRESFRRLRELEVSCRPYTKGFLSMGMSQDFEEAVAEGATHIRVGTLLVGPRPD